MAMLFQKTARTGWYYRVLEEGIVCLGDTITLQARPCPDWTVETVTRARFNRHLDPKIAPKIIGTGCA